MATAPLTGSPSINLYTQTLAGGTYTNQTLISCPPNTIMMVSLSAFSSTTNTNFVSLYGQGLYPNSAPYVPFSFNISITGGVPVTTFSFGSRMATQAFINNTTVATPYGEPGSGAAYLYPLESLKFDAIVSGTQYFVYAVYQLSGS